MTRPHLFAACASLAAVFTFWSFAQNAQPDKKQLEAHAKQLIGEGKALEDQGKLNEAKDKYIDAEAVYSTSDALDAIKRINDAQKQKAETALGEARRLYDAGNYKDSLDQLRHGLETTPGSPAFEFDVALCYLKLGDRANAELYLEMATSGMGADKERPRLLELDSSILMGTEQPAAVSDPPANVEAFNASYREQDRDAADPKAAGGSLCQQTAQLKTAYPTNPAVVFNAAKCAEEDATQGDAALELASYVMLAPNALDRSDAEALVRSWQSLSDLPGDTGQSVRRHFANASRYLDYRRYDHAIGEYEDAAKDLPDFAQTEWQLGLLYEACGNVAKTRDHFKRFQQLEKDPARHSAADAHVANIDRRRAVYDANVRDAQDILTGLLLPSLGISNEGAKHKDKLTHRQRRYASSRYKEESRATEKLSEPYVEREFDRARQDLDSAADLFPLAAEANQMLALIYLQGNNWPEAYRSYDAVASQGFPVSFYAQEPTGTDDKEVRAVKVEISANSIRIITLATYDSSKKISTAPDQSAGDDDLGNLVISAGTPPDPDAQAVTIHAEDLKGIETQNNFVELKLAKDKIYLAPLNMLSTVPFEGGAARTYGNEYTRMFIRYLGFEDAKLGKEGMTNGEKFMLGFQIARIGMGVAMMGVGAPMAYGSAVRMVQLVHALQIFHEVTQGVRAVNVTDATISLADDLAESVETLERTSSEERRAVEGIHFKFIPDEPVPLKFKEKI
jgi:tetratricopeptide (TPR) repeat protein